MATFQVEQFSVSVSDEVLADLRARIRNTRWPGARWEQGTDLGYLRGLLEYWADGFDWRAQERWLNGFRHFRAGIYWFWPRILAIRRHRDNRGPAREAGSSTL